MRNLCYATYDDLNRFIRQQDVVIAELEWRLAVQEQKSTRCAKPSYQG